MSNLSFRLVLIALLLTFGFSYAIEGNWKVTHVGQEEVDSEHGLSMKINDFVFRNTSIMWTLSIEGCRNFKYILEVEEGNLYVDLESFFLSKYSTRQCEQSYIDKEKDLNQLLIKSFKFQILSNFMIFSDFSGTVLIKFQRLVQNPIYYLDGNWVINLIKSKKTSQLLEIFNHTMTFCQGKANLQFQIVAKNTLQITDFQDNGCESEQMLKVMHQIIYFRIIGDELTFYSEEVKTLFVADFYQDAQTALKQKQEKQKRELEEAKQREKLTEQRRQQILRQRELERIRLQKTKEQTKFLPKLKNTVQDLIGKWKIYNIYGIPVPIQNFQVVITEDQIILSGGCNTHIVAYLEENNEITVGDVRSTKKLCANDEDGLYKRGLEKLNKYEVSIDGSEIVAVISDQSDSLVYELRRDATVVTISTTQKQPSTPQPVSPPPRIVRQQPALFPGKYMMLLLKRRDLPRKLGTLTPSSFSFKICNRIELSYNLQGQNISFNQESKEGAVDQCDLNREEPYLQFLSKVKTFKRDQLDVMLMDEEGEEIVNWSFIG